MQMKKSQWSHSFTKTALFTQGRGDHVIAYKDKVYLINPTDSTSADHDLMKRISLDLDIPFNGSPWDLLSSITDHRPDVLYGRIDNGWFEIYRTSGFYHGQTSYLLSKVVNHLGLEGVKYTSDGEDYKAIFTEDLSGELPEASISRYEYSTCR